MGISFPIGKKEEKIQNRHYYRIVWCPEINYIFFSFHSNQGSKKSLVDLLVDLEDWLQWVVLQVPVAILQCLEVPA